MCFALRMALVDTFVRLGHDIIGSVDHRLRGLLSARIYVRSDNSRRSEDERE